MKNKILMPCHSYLGFLEKGLFFINFYTVLSSDKLIEYNFFKFA